MNWIQAALIVYILVEAVGQSDSNMFLGGLMFGSVTIVTLIHLYEKK